MGWWSWLEDSLGSRRPGLPVKPLWGPGRSQVSGIYEGWGQPGFLPDVPGQTSRGCPPLARLHPPDLHPWPRQTDRHLTAGKQKALTFQVCAIHRTAVRTVKTMCCLPEGLPARGEGALGAVLSDGAENGSTPAEAVNTPEQNLIYSL